MAQQPENTPATLISASQAGLCLDFANTRYWRGTGEPTETLTRFDDVFTWLSAANALDPAAVEDLRTRWPSGQGGEAAFADILALREALYRTFSAIARREAPREEDLARLNRALADAPPRTQLVNKHGAYLWRVEKLEPKVADLLTPVLWTAGDMIAEPRRDRVRLCANDKCVWLFLDDSKSGTRRWCDMKACGNRAKAHRHYEKKKKAAAKSGA